MNATVSKRVIKVYIQSAIELFGSFSERAGNHKNLNSARIKPAFLPSLFLFIQKFRFIQCKNLNIDSKTYSSNSFSTKNQFKKYSKLSFPKIFNSKKYPFSDFLRNSIQKYYSKLDFFFDSIQKNYSKLDFFSDSIQRNIHSIPKKEYLPPLPMGPLLTILGPNGMWPQ